MTNPSSFPLNFFLKKRKRKVVQGLLHDPLPQHDLVCFILKSNALLIIDSVCQIWFLENSALTFQHRISKQRLYKNLPLYLMYFTSKHHKFLKPYHLYKILFLFFWYPFYISNPMNFAWTYCLMNFAWILLKFHDIGNLWWICSLKITLNFFILNHKYLELNWGVEKQMKKKPLQCFSSQPHFGFG